ncbi:MAG: ribosome biogenesis GTPase YlqF [Deltaproteobacteria bacterium]|nr:ribosome biogenesis GTPase YlqF [Deltaproteobacteria bacterium]
MSIEWFPGHMLTAKKEAAEAMAKNDVVIEVLDARIPYASCNPMIETLRKKNQRPALKILNKVDLADPEQTRAWLDYYNRQDRTRAIALAAKNSGEVARIPKECAALTASSAKRKQPLCLMILGVPNVGKSTLMNTLLGKPVAKVGNEPAITKHQMRHQLKNGMWLTDTPGMLWPGVSQESAVRLAAVHSIGRNAYTDDEVALFLAKYLLQHYRAAFESRFKATEPYADEHAAIAQIAKARSYAAKGAPDLSRAAAALLTDFRSGAIGRITLERVEALRLS